MSAAAEFFRITTVDETASTNSTVKGWAARGEKAGAVLIAYAQSAGRGRMGRSFFSPAGTGLYMSVLLRPDWDGGAIPLLTPAAALAACRAIETVAGERPGVKWVNDLLLCGKKVCGILAEGVPGEYIVLGAGFNLCAPEGGFPPDIAEIAGAIWGRGPCTDMARETLAAQFLEELYKLYAVLPDTAFLSEYRARCVTLGRRVRVPGDPPYEALAESIDDSGALIVRLDGGQMRRIAAGEVSVKNL